MTTKSKAAADKGKIILSVSLAILLPVLYALICFHTPLTAFVGLEKADRLWTLLTLITDCYLVVVNLP